MKLRNPEDHRSIARDRRDMTPGPDRLARLLKLLDADIAQYPLDANPPPAVTAAHEAYLVATSVARQTAAGVETAKEAAGTAAGADLSAAMQAIQAGKITPKSTTQPKAADAIAAAVNYVTAAENLVGEAQAHLVDAVQAVWPEWRAQIVRDAAAARVRAAKATKAATEAVATGRALFAAVGQLDNEVLSRDAKLLQAVSEEMREGLPWFEATHTVPSSPLTHVSIPGVEHDKRPRRLDLAVVVEAVAAAVAEAGTFPASDWTPPSAPGHADLLAEPLDPATPWVKDRVRREYGDVCVICKLPRTDEAVEVVGATWPWAMVHTKCKNKAPDPKELKRLDRAAAMSHRGFDAQPGQTQHWQR